MAILSIDAGTTGVTALAIDERGQMIARGYSEFPQYFPHPGWVEHDPVDIWKATLVAVSSVLSSISPSQFSSIGITNQRETILVWNNKDFSGPRRGIVWQDRRSTSIVDELRNQGHEPLIQSVTGLGLDPYFSASKYLWLARNERDIWNKIVSRDYLIGTVDSYLISRMTRGKVHVTDASNASRTQLLNLKTCEWDERLLDLFNVPRHILPQIVPSYGVVGSTDSESFLGLNLPISGIAGDQQAALFGQAAFNVGDSKCTYGTGSFILCNTGAEPKFSKHGLLTTIAWKEPSGELTYALEGAVFVTGAAVQWLRDGLGIIQTLSEVEDLASEVTSSDGVIFIPALSGLGAPHWNPNARGSIQGITRGTTVNHIARATLEAIAFQVRDVVDAMVKDTNQPLRNMRVDGGAVSNNLLMQLQADVLKASVIRGRNLESTALGAAFLAGLGTGIWSSKDELKKCVEVEREFLPELWDESIYSQWKVALKRLSS